MAEELPLPDSTSREPLLCRNIQHTWLCQPSSPRAAPAGWGWKRLWSDSRAQGCSKAHPQPGCQLYPNPHLQAWSKRYKNTKVATAASNPQIPARFPGRARSGATLPTVQDWEVWDSYSWVTTKSSYWGKGILFHVYKNVNITVFYPCLLLFIYNNLTPLYTYI